MKKLTNGLVLGLAVAALTGCSTVKVEPGSDTYIEPRGSQAVETEIVRAAIPVTVLDNTVPSDGLSSDVVALAKGRLAAGGYTVDAGEAYVTVRLRTSVAPFDKFGNYYVYEGQLGVNVTRADGKLLANELVSVKSDRVLESERALINARQKISDEAGNAVTRVVNEKTTGMESVIVVMRNITDGRAANIAKAIRKQPGVFSCNKLPQSPKGVIEYRVIYDAKSFPDSIQGVVDKAARNN